MKLNKFIILVLIVFSFSCKTNNKEFNKKTVTLEKKANLDVKSKNDTIKTKNNLTLDYLQGIWRSYSYYLEHEQESKDFHINEYYMVVSGKKSLEIVLKHHDLDSLYVQTNILGFLDKKKRNIEISDLKKQGKLFIKVKSLTNNINKERILNIKKDNISKNFESYFDGNDIFDDYFNYKFINDSISEKVTFIRLSILPKMIFKKIKKQSQKDNRDYIAEFNIKSFSQKIQVTADKTYFYNDSDLKEKRKAFLVKGDIAYLENLGENEVQVYFDGKVITSGYLKLSDVKVIE